MSGFISYTAVKWTNHLVSRFSTTAELCTLILFSQEVHEVDHGLINQLLADSEETLNSCTEKMQGPAQYSWSSDWSFWVISANLALIYKYNTCLF